MTDPSVSLRLPARAGGPWARPRRGDRALPRPLEDATVYDVALVVSELVTNSVNHPGPEA